MEIINADIARLRYHVARYTSDAYAQGLGQFVRTPSGALAARHQRTGAVWLLTEDNRIALRVAAGRRWITDEADHEHF